MRYRYALVRYKEWKRFNGNIHCRPRITDTIVRGTE